MRQRSTLHLDMRPRAPDISSGVPAAIDVERERRLPHRHLVDWYAVIRLRPLEAEAVDIGDEDDTVIELTARRGAALPVG